MSAAAPTALAQAIRATRIRVGSHDKLVAKLKTDHGMTKASRTLVINWEKGAVPTGGYRDALVEMGVDADLFGPLDPSEYQPAPIAIMQEALENQREIRARLESLEEKVGQVAEVAASVLEALEGGQGRGRAAS